MPLIGQFGHLINDKAELWWWCSASPMSRTWNIKSQGTLAATRVYNLCVCRSYTNRNTTQGTMVCPATLSSLSLLAHDFMLEANIPCMICTSTYTAMALWTIDSVLCTHSMILHELPPHYTFQYSPSHDYFFKITPTIWSNAFHLPCPVSL